MSDTTHTVGVGVPGGKWHAVFHDVSTDGRSTRIAAQCNRTYTLTGQTTELDVAQIDVRKLCGRCFR